MTLDKSTERYRVLFVCTGNICRSPTAEGVFRTLVADAGLDHRIEADSAGVQGYHIGDPPDSRATAAAAARGYNLAGQSARRVSASDFLAFDLIVGMDWGHVEYLQRALWKITQENRRTERVCLLPGQRRPEGIEVPDPYYGGAGDFENALDLVEDGCKLLLDELQGKSTYF